MSHRFWIIVLLFFAGVAVADTTPKKIKVAVTDNIVPFQYLDENNQAQGIVIDIWRLWQQKTGVEVEFVHSNWPMTITNVQQGSADVHGAIMETEERKSYFQFGGKVYTATTAIYLHKELVGIDTLDKLSPHVVGALRNSIFQKLLTDKNPDVKFHIYDSRKDMLEGVVKGQVKAFTSYDFLELRFQGQEEIKSNYPAYKRLVVDDFDGMYAVTKENSYLLDVLERGFSQITDDERQRINKKWLGKTRDHSGLMLGFSEDNAPYMFTNVEGEPTGLFIDLWRKWAEKTQTDVRFMPNSMSLSIEALEQGKSDVHIAYPQNQINQFVGDLSRALNLYTVISHLFLHKDFDGELAGQKIGAFETSPYKEDMLTMLPNSEVVWFNSLEDMINASMNKEIVGFIASNQMTRLRLMQNNINNMFNLKPEYVFESQIFSLVDQQNEALITKIVEGFNLISQQEFEDIEKRWIQDPTARHFENRGALIQFTDQQRAWIKDNPVITVGASVDLKPFEFEDENGEIVGINRDIFSLASKLTGQEFQFKKYPNWEELLNDFRTGKIDMLGNISKSPERESFATFTSSYWDIPWAIVTHKSVENFDTIKGIYGKRIAYITGYQIGHDIARLHPQVSLIPVKNSEEALELLRQERIDGVLDNIIVTTQYIRDYELYQFKVMVLDDLRSETSHIGINKSLPIQAEIMESVIQAITDKQRGEIQEKWFSLDVNAGISSRKYFRNITAAVLGLSFVILAVVLWNRRLKKEISLRKQAERKLKHLASHDALTGLPNRTLLMDRLSQSLAGHSRHSQQLAIMFLDLDGFKQVNDTFGHDLGDELLVQVTERLKHCVRKSDTVARFGGDEFILLVTDLNVKTDAELVAQKIIAEFSEEFVLSRCTVNVGVSMGIAYFPEHSSDADELLKFADIAMYQVKESGKNSFIVFKPT